MRATEDLRTRTAPAWLQGLGALAVVAIVATLVYAVVIAALNFHRIGV